MVNYYKKEGKEFLELRNLEDGCWVNIEPPFTQEEIEEVSQKLDIPLDFLTDSLDIDERSRYEREDDVRLIVLNTPIRNQQAETMINEALYITVPIGIILTPDHIVTITSYENPVLIKFINNTIKNFTPSDHSLFVLQLFEQNVYRFLTCLKKLNGQRNLIEKELYNSSKNRQLKQLLSIEKSLVYFVTALSANELLKMKMKRSNYLHITDDEDKLDLFEDIIIDNSQALEMSHVYTNILSGTMDAFASIISNNLNIVIQRLTLVTIILMVPTLVASFFGMNLKTGLENTEYSFIVVIILTIVITIIMTWIFRWKRMI